jgi:LPPG:FO 2-phospho-L-lactate transferase
VSPLVGGKAIKGPAVQMMTALGHTADAIGVAGIYGDLVDAFVIDEVDQALAPGLARPGRDIWVEQTVMRTAEDKGALAKRIMGRISEMGLGKVHS